MRGTDADAAASPPNLIWRSSARAIGQFSSANEVEAAMVSLRQPDRVPIIPKNWFFTRENGEQNAIEVFRAQFKAPLLARHSARCYSCWLCCWMRAAPAC